MAAKRRRHKRARHHRKHRRNASAAPTASNPRRRRHRAKRRNPRRYVARTGRGRRMRTYRVRNKHGKRLFHVRGYRARRKNPGTGGLVAAAVAVGVGLLASVATSYVVDTFLSSQSAMVQTGVLVAVAGGAAFFLPNHPALAAGIATGLLLVPLAKQVYTIFPSLANPMPATPTASNPQIINPPAPGAAASLSALHRGMGRLHGMGKLAYYKKPNRANHRLNALHMGSLHMGNLGGSNNRSATLNRVFASR